MLIAKPKVQFKTRFNDYDIDFRPQDEYLFAKDVFMLFPPATQQAFTVKEEHEYPFKYYNGENLSGKTLLVIGQLAYGDAICMTPALREIKKRYPDMKLWVTVSGRARICFEGLPYIDEIFTMPIVMDYVKKADYIVKCVEMVNTEEFDLQNMVNYYLHKFRLYDCSDLKPDFFFTPNDYIVNFLTQVKNTERKKFLLFHPQASSVNRSIGFQTLKGIESDEYIPVVALQPELTEDVNVQLKAVDIQKAINMSSQMTDIRALANVVSQCDVVLSVDTVTNHIAATMDKPTVLLSCAIHPSYRSSTYEYAVPLTMPYSGKICIAPCNKHNFPESCFEAKIEDRYYPPCLTEIPAEVIKQAIKDAELIKEYKNLKEQCYCGSKHTRFFEVINGCAFYHCLECGLYFTTAEKYGKLHEFTSVASLNRFTEAFEKIGIKLLTTLEKELVEDFTHSDMACYIVPNYRSLYFQGRPPLKYVWWDSRFYPPASKMRFTQESLYRLLSKRYNHVKVFTTPLTFDFLLQSVTPYGVIINSGSIPPEATAQVLTLNLKFLIANANSIGEYLIAICDSKPIELDVEKLNRFASIIINFGGQHGSQGQEKR